MSESEQAARTIAALEQEATEALRQGRTSQAHAAWLRILALAPGHLRALTMVGQGAFIQGDFEAAKIAFQRAADADGQNPRPWVNLALAHQRLGNEAAEEAALKRALIADASDLLALLLRGNLYERQGRMHEAAQAFGAAAAVAPPMDRLSPELRPSLTHAQQFRHEYDARLAVFLDARLDAVASDLAGEDLSRVRLSADLLLGRKKRFDSQPMRHFVPGLLPVEFFERRDFPFLDAFETETPTIRDELLAVLHEDTGFEPYMRYGPDMPLQQWSELNQSLRWSAFHLVKDGTVVAGNASRCPRTMALWQTVPSPEQPGRTPVALFSLLKPRTRIPPHVGASNCRLLAHVPLIVPADCGFRVGNQTRQWVPGQAWVFDDTIEHEAWNNSDELRAIMIFDLWHPKLTPAERRMVSAMSSALNEFTGSSGGFDA